MKLPQLYTLKEAAEALRCSTKTIMRYIEAGHFPAYKPNRTILIPKKGVREFLESGLMNLGEPMKP